MQSWSDVESAVRRAAKLGEPTDLRTADTEGANDPAGGESWGPERTLRAGLLRELALSEVSEGPLRVRGARVTGPFDLSGASLSRAVVLEGCFFDQPITVREALGPAVRLSGTCAPGLDAEQLETRGDLDLRGFVARGQVRLVGARIGGRLELSGATLQSSTGPALDAKDMRVDQGMFCREGFSAHGEVLLIGAHIGAQLDFSGADIVARDDGRALTADRITVDGPLFARAVNSAEWYEWFDVEGEVRLAGAHIRGDLDLSGATLKHRVGGRSLAANGLTVEQDVYLDDVTAEGQVRLLGARVGGSVGLLDATFANGEEVALLAERLTVEQDLFAVRFEAVGDVVFSGARIGGLLDFTDARLVQEEGRRLDLARVRAVELILLPETPPGGTVTLEGAQVGRFVDDEATWPRALHLRGFSYDALGGEAKSVDARLRWLELQPDGFVPDAYDRLAAAYLGDGREEDARRVRIAKQARRRTELRLPGRLWSDFLRWTVGYG